MGRGKRLKLGNIYEIGLPNGKKHMLVYLRNIQWFL